MGGGGLRRKPVRVAVADGFAVGFSVQMGAWDSYNPANLGLAKGGPGPEEIPSAEAVVPEYSYA